MLNVQIELIIACYSGIIKGRNLCRLLFSYLILNVMKKWMIVDSDIDFMLQKRVLDSLLTYRNWKRLDRFCRKHSKSHHIASDYDCTGQICGTYYYLKIEDKKFVLYLCTTYDC